MRGFIQLFASLITLPFQIAGMVLSTTLPLAAMTVKLPFQIMGLLLAGLAAVATVVLQLVVVLAALAVIAALILGFHYVRSERGAKVDRYVMRAHERAQRMNERFAEQFGHDAPASIGAGEFLVTESATAPEVFAEADFRDDSEEEDEVDSEECEECNDAVDVHVATAIADNDEPDEERVIKSALRSHAIVISQSRHDSARAARAAAKAEEIAHAAALHASQSGDDSDLVPLPSENSSGPRPEWVDAIDEHLGAGVHRVTALCGPCESKAECRRQLQQEVKSSTLKYVSGQVHTWVGSGPLVDWMTRIWVDDAFRRRQVEVKSTFTETRDAPIAEISGQNHFIYGLLEFDPRFREMLRQDLRSWLRSSRLAAYWVAAMLGISGVILWLRGTHAPNPATSRKPAAWLAWTGAVAIWLLAGGASLASISWIPWL